MPKFSFNIQLKVKLKLIYRKFINKRFLNNLLKDTYIGNKNLTFNIN